MSRARYPVGAGKRLFPLARPTLARGARVPAARLVRAVVAAAGILIALAPTIFAVVYYGLVASDRYVSEARFVVKAAARPNVGGGLASFLQMTGITRAQDDTFAVQEFILSRTAVTSMPDSVDLRAIYGRDEADRLARFPNLFYGTSVDELHNYMGWRIGVSFNPNTSISTLTVQAFRPEDAQKVARALLDLSEDVINRINVRIRDDSIRFAQTEVENAQRRVLDAQAAITDFRNREMMIDPARNSLLVLELVGRLSGELSQTRATITEVTAASPNTPQIAALERRAAALESQIAKERARLTSGSDGLANKIAVYERLVIEKEFSTQMLASAITALEGARAEARRQQLYLQRIVEPTLPDYPLQPRRWFTTVTIMIGNLMLLLVLWLIKTGVGSHGFSSGRR